jgi:hypothetical protein
VGVGKKEQRSDRISRANWKTISKLINLLFPFSFSLSPSLCHSLCVSVCFPSFLTLSLTRTPSLPPCFPFCHSLTHPLMLFLSSSISFSLSLPVSLPLSFPHYLAQATHLPSCSLLSPVSCSESRFAVLPVHICDLHSAVLQVPLSQPVQLLVRVPHAVHLTQQMTRLSMPVSAYSRVIITAVPMTIR